jgi:hypothetical protein
LVTRCSLPNSVLRVNLRVNRRNGRGLFLLRFGSAVSRHLNTRDEVESQRVHHVQVKNGSPTLAKHGASRRGAEVVVQLADFLEQVG